MAIKGERGIRGRARGSREVSVRRGKGVRWSESRAPTVLEVEDECGGKLAGGAGQLRLSMLGEVACMHAGCGAACG